MAEIKSSTPAPAATDDNNQKHFKPPPTEASASTETALTAPPVPLYKIYGQPAPIRTFPLPSFYPNNPISLFHVVFAWIGQALFPPPPEPSVIHTGIWSPETRSIHITDPKSIRALWEQGFYGKGNYSRSEPNWLKREKIRQGLVEGNVSEQLTNARRAERIQAKWQRAREEQEAIERTRQEEARLANAIINGAPEVEQIPLASPIRVSPIAPVGPLELLALPNSEADLAVGQLAETIPNGFHNVETLKAEGLRTTALSHTVHAESPTICPTTAGTLIDPSVATHEAYVNGAGKLVNGVNGIDEKAEAFPDVLPSVNGDKPNSIQVQVVDGSNSSSTTTLGGPTSPLKRRKSVRFSPKVESTTFQLSDPPSPYHSPANSLKNGNGGLVNGIRAASMNKPDSKEEVSPTAELSKISSPAIVDKEHLQLTPEEAFFLTFALGALRVVDRDTKTPISTPDVFLLFRQHSYFPPRISTPSLLPDDPFLVHYVVYHHFRSMGWVPRPGVKFGVDWLLYQRGPVFDHAEFGLIVLPSYSDPRWKEDGHTPPQRSWHWLHGINRVLSHVLKSLVLVYVDVPHPAALGPNETDGSNITNLLKKYKVREIMVRRWSSNRNR